MLIKTTSCDAGVRVDLWCDSCDVLFSPRASTPQVLSAVWEAATARGWSATGPSQTGRHLCRACTDTRGGERLAEVAPGVT
ncbi:MAG: hypothetical protein JWP76_5114 [Dactylosporangium sp.]|nr:hypothetical protein [Dactylosporangium sp.]